MTQNLICIISTIIAMLVGRFIWDRYLSQSSRVTVKECKKQMELVKLQLEDGTATFKRINSGFAAFCLIMLKLCERAGIECDDIRKLIIKSGLDL